MIDPIQNLRGFFQWKNGRIEKLKGYYIYDDVGRPIKIEQTKVKKEAPKPAKTSRLASVLIALLCVGTYIFADASAVVSALHRRTYFSEEAIPVGAVHMDRHTMYFPYLIKKNDHIVTASWYRRLSVAYHRKMKHTESAADHFVGGWIYLFNQLKFMEPLILFY